MPVAWDEILSAFEFASMGETDNAAFLCRETGKIFYRSDLSDDLDELPDDIEDGTKYVAVPGQHDLDLGRRLVMRFAAEDFADHYDDVAAIFSRSGAYRRFKDLLIREEALERWYAFEAAAKEQALREWCAENDVAVEG